MTKRFLFALLSLLAAGGLTWFLLIRFANSEVCTRPFSHQEVVKAASQVFGESATNIPVVAPAAPLAPSHPVRLAIGSLGLPEDAANRQLGDLVLAELTGAPGLELVDRQSMDKVLREAEMSLAGLARAKDAIRVGQLLRAEWFLLGSTATINGTTSVVARVVDARTGILRDIQVLPHGGNPTQTAAELARFLRGCRQAASAAAKPHMFLAVGAFADVSVNNRQAAFAGQLRAYLTGAFQHSDLTLLEREQVNALLQEVRLDLAGLTEQSPGQTPAPLQSAFWLVDGFYQSFETSSFEVELSLRISRIFGRDTTRTFRGPPGAALFGQVKTAIDSTLARQDSLMLAPSRLSEIRQQLALGKDLVRTATGRQDLRASYNFWVNLVQANAQADPQRRHNLKEAAQAFETVLLLDPQHAEAKFCLAVCYADRTMGQMEQAQHCLRELAASPVESPWAQDARTALAGSYRDTDPQQAAHWFDQAAQHCTDATEAALYRNKAAVCRADAELQALSAQDPDGASPKAQTLQQAQFFDRVRSAQSVLQGEGGVIDDTYGLNYGLDQFGTNRLAKAERLDQLWPALTNSFPELVPHLLSAAVSFQVDTNAPIVAEFRNSVAHCRQRPQQVLGCPKYFERLLRAPYNWCLQHQLYALAAELVDAKRQAALEYPALSFDHRDQVRLAFIYLKQARWSEALPVLDALGKNPILMDADGPWGEATAPFLPAQAAARCRQQLGLPPVPAAGTFELGRPWLCLHTPAAVAVGPQALWVATKAKLLELSLNWHTNRSISLPIDPSVPITALWLGPQHIWIGTAGAGLLAYDPGSGTCRRWTEADGLQLNHISCLYLQDNTLWLGFKQAAAGGVGKLDLATGRLTAFTPHLAKDLTAATTADASDAPPRHPVIALLGRTDELWVKVEAKPFRHYRIPNNTWEALPSIKKAYINCLAASSDQLVAGLGISQVEVQMDNAPSNTNANPLSRTNLAVSSTELARMQADKSISRRIRSIGYYTLPSKGALGLRASGNSEWQTFANDGCLPTEPTLLTLDGSNLWVAGRGYIALFDLPLKKLRSFCSIPAREVDSLQVGGGFLWVKYDRHLYRTPLDAIQPGSAPDAVSHQPLPERHEQHSRK